MADGPYSEEHLHHIKTKLDAWHKRSLWGNYGNTDTPTAEEMQRRESAVTRYTLRMLSRRQIPNPDLVFDTLSGKRPVPECSYIGCSVAIEHIH